MELEHHEVVRLLLALGVWGFVASVRDDLRAAVPGRRLLYAVLALYTVAWTFTILEGAACREAFNFIAHLAQSCAALVLALWAWGLGRDAGTGAA